MNNYILINTKTKKYLKGFKGNKPFWVTTIAKAVWCNLAIAKRLKKQLEKISLDNIVLEQLY